MCMANDEYWASLWKGKGLGARLGCCNASNNLEHGCVGVA